MAAVSSALQASELVFYSDAFTTQEAAMQVLSASTFSIFGVGGGTATITNAAAPVNPLDLANKAYVDSAAAGLSWQPPVDVTTTAAIVLGALGDGSQLATDTIDSITFTVTDVGARILVNDQTPDAPGNVANGIYQLTLCTNPSFFFWARSSTMAAGSDAGGYAVYTQLGTVNGGTAFVETLDPAVVGTDALKFTTFASITPVVPGGTSGQVQYNNAGSFGGSTLAFSGGNFNVTSGDFTVDTGDIAATAGNVVAGDSMTAANDVTATTGDITAVAGAVSAATTVTAGTGITATAGDIIASAGSVTGNLNVTAVNGDVVATTGNVEATLGSVTAGTTVTAGTGVTATTGNVEASVGDVIAGANVTATTGSVTAGTSMTANTNITATTGDIVATAGDVNAGNSMTAGTNITATAGDITATAGDIIASIGNIVATTGDVTAGNVVTAGAGITSTTGNIVATSGDMTANGSVTATTGAVSAGSTVTAGTSVTATTTVTAGTGMTATTGDITADAGDVVVTLGDITVSAAGSQIAANGTANATSTTTGAIVTLGGIGVAQDVYIGGSAYATSFKAFSDATLKTNIVPLTGTLDIVKQIEGFQYNWIDENMGTELQTGVLAQQLESIGLEHIVDSEHGHKTVAYMELIPYLIGAIKELSQEVDELRGAPKQSKFVPFRPLI